MYRLAVAGLLGGIVIMAFSFDIVKVSSDSMEPAMYSGDYILIFSPKGLVNQVVPLERILRRHSVIVFSLSSRKSDNAEYYIKRIEAMAYDRVRVDQGCLILNGLGVEDPYAYYSAPALRLRDTWPFARRQGADVVIPEGAVFVLGDNRAGSTDSRVFGPLARSSIIGVVICTLHI